VKIIVVVIGLAAAFWAGHAYSSYKITEGILPTLLRSESLRSASLMLRTIDGLDAGESSALRGKLLAVAKSELEHNPETSTNWKAVFAPPLMDDEAMPYLRSKNEADLVKLKQEIEALESSPGSAGSNR